MKVLLPILLMVFAFQGSYSQKDPQARKILDKVSTQSQAEYPIQVSFEYIYEDLMDKQTSTQSGTLIIAEQKFRLNVGESEVYSNGITVWNYLTSANEVYVSDAEEGNASDEFFISDPSDLFTFYQEGFKYRLKGEIEYNEQTYFEIDIFPENLEKNYHTVKLLISKKDHRIYSAQAYGKQGVNHTVILTGYQKKVSTDTNTFVFDPAEHPGVEVVDTRF
ncbi:outer membrane lipoprotein carrier protein LolA [Bacteroidota bacterium]